MRKYTVDISAEKNYCKNKDKNTTQTGIFVVFVAHVCNYITLNKGFVGMVELKKYTITVNGKIYTGCGKLTFKCQSSLIENEDFQPFADYVSVHGLLADAEIKLINSNKFDWFKFYIQIHSLDYKAEKLLLQPGRADWLGAYVLRPIRTKYTDRLNPKLEQEIVLSDDFDLFKTYVDRCGLKTKSQIMLINSGKFDWFKYYVQKSPVYFGVEKWLKMNKKEWFDFYQMARMNVR